jgi:hypothetical protein
MDSKIGKSQPRRTLRYQGRLGLLFLLLLSVLLLLLLVLLLEQWLHVY